MTRSILITGCSSGIGLASARMMRDRGWRVFATVRKPEDARRLEAEGLTAPLLDHADPASIERAVAQVLDATGGTLDALFNNAAHGLPGAVEDLPPEALAAIFQANVFGVQDVTRRIIPVMRRQGHGRIIMHSSVLGYTPFPWRGAYVATKYALEGLTHTLRIEMRDTPIHISLMNTGPVPTKIRENSIPHFERFVDWKSSPRRAQYESELLPRLYEPSGKKDPFELPPEAVARKLAHACEARRPRARYYVTKVAWISAALQRLLPIRVTDRILGGY